MTFTCGELLGFLCFYWLFVSMIDTTVCPTGGGGGGGGGGNIHGVG